MENNIDLIKELELKTEVIKFNYMNLFKSFPKSSEEFIQENYAKIRSELAKVSTDILHTGILNNIKNEEFINRVLTINSQTIFELLNELQKSEKK